MTLQGIDVSGYQGDVDWEAIVGVGLAFALIKFTEGTTYVDASAPANWVGAKDAGVARFAYHFARFSRNAVVDEVTHFWNMLQGVGGLRQYDGIALDQEDDDVAPDADLLPQTLEFVERIEALAHLTPLFYSRRGYMIPHNLTGSQQLGRCGLWIAEYGVAAPTIPAGWDFYAFWQYADTRTEPGISGPVDSDQFNGTLDQLHAYGLQAPVKPAMSNDDVVETPRRLLANNMLNPADAVTYLEQFS